MQIKKTVLQKTADVTRAWHLVDAKGRVLGDVATEIATLLIGKHKLTYTPHIDGGDYVVVINGAEVAVTGSKGADKQYYQHSGYPGGLSQKSYDEMQQDFPGRVIELAVKNMLPKNRLQANRMTRLRVFPNAEHPHQAHFSSKKDVK
jgi:large subunit ribosomal protein L13